MYGVYVNSFVFKFKDKYVIIILLEVVNEKFLKDKIFLFEKGLDMLKEIIWNLLIKDRCFDYIYVV